MFVYIIMYVLQCTYHRDINGLLEVECSIEIDLNILKDQNILLYKYFIAECPRHTDAETDKKCYEYLHGAPGGDKIKNRVFWVPKDEANGKHSITHLRTII